MDWIEHIFHVSPDGGSGVLETLIVIAAFVVAAGPLVLAIWWRGRSR
jgi:hypothetical protein